MLNPEAVESFNTRLTRPISDVTKLTASERDRVRTQGDRAEALLKNRDFAQFIHEFKFEVCDDMAAIRGHTADDNSRRVALSNQIAGIDSFVALLQRAVYYRTRVSESPRE